MSAQSMGFEMSEFGHQGADRIASASSPETDAKRLATNLAPHTYAPKAEGLYDPALEKDSCGVGFIADIKGRKSHQIVHDALTLVGNL